MMDMQNAKIIDIYERMFAEEGWKELVGDLKERREHLKNQLITPSATDKDLYTIKGMCYAYGYIIELESMMETAKKQGMLDESSPALPDV